MTLKDSSSDLDQGFRDNSINSLDLNISFPAIKSYARVFNGKINIHIDEEEKNNQEIIQKINDEILKLKENGLICDIPNFSLSKPQNNPDSNVSGKSSPFIPHMPTRNKHIIDWPEDSTDELQTTVNIVHPQIRNLF